MQQTLQDGATEHAISNARARVFYDRCGFVDRGDYDMLLLDGAGLAALGNA